MPIIRKQLIPSQVYPEDLRYNETTGTIQSLVNGEWVDNPDADPRNQTTFPARTTANTACDAAESVKDAFKTQIDGVLAAIDGAQSAFTIAGIILSLFTFGVFGVFIALALFLAHAMLDAGTIAIAAALTPAVYHTFMCILDCQFDPLTGRLIPGSMGAIQASVTDQIGGIGAVILNQMLNLAGEGGVNNLAALGTSTGDCDDCGCEPCEFMTDFHLWSYGSQPFGLDIQFGTNFMEITPELYSGDGAYYITLSTEDVAKCCTPITLEYLDQQSHTTFYNIWNACGGPNTWEARTVSLPFNNSLISFSLGWLTNPGRVKITFDP